MGGFIIKRLLISLPILLVITILLFGLLQLTPGDPLDALVPPDQTLSPAQREAIRHEYGLDQPTPVRYFYWLVNTLQGNLGYRSKNFEPVIQAIGSHVGPTLLLMGVALTTGVLLGIVFGVISALKQYSWLDLIMTLSAFLGISIPAFLAGLIGLYVFALQLHWFPAGGFATPGQPASVTDIAYHLILPGFILSIFFIASIMRYTRSAMLEVLSQDYMRTAQAKGLAHRVVVIRHGLRNALLPVVTIIGVNVANLLGGAVFIETIFSWPGMGQLFLDGVESRDYPLIMGLTLVLAITILLANLLTDVAYGIIDPRIRYR